jgi:hypothetical protein
MSSTDSKIEDTKTKKTSKKSEKKTVEKTSEKKSAKKTSKKSEKKTSEKKSSKKAESLAKDKPVKESKDAAVDEKVSKKVASKKTESDVKSESKKIKRNHNIKPSSIDYAGIGIGSARAKRVLITYALNAREAAAHAAVLKAENKPVRPKPTGDNAAPEVPPQGPQTPVSKLDEKTLEVVREAERVHRESLREDYEKEQVKKLDEKSKKAYVEARKNAIAEGKFALTSGGLDVEAFNKSFNKNFYNGFDAYLKEHDLYILGRKFKDTDGKEYVKYNEWTRAAALINKLCIRLSNESRYILAAFLDNIVRQYAKNGIINCLKEDRSIVLLRHALGNNESFSSNVTLDPFVRTLNNYQYAKKWISECEAVKENNKKHKNDEKFVKQAEPLFADPGYSENFEGYVADICRSVRVKLAEADQTNKNKYLETSISTDFKKFCSYIIFESILRIGSILNSVVTYNRVKTVSNTLMKHAINQVYSTCGVSHVELDSDIDARLKFFAQYRKERKEKKGKKSGSSDEVEVELDE